MDMTRKIAQLWVLHCPAYVREASATVLLRIYIEFLFEYVLRLTVVPMLSCVEADFVTDSVCISESLTTR